MHFLQLSISCHLCLTRFSCNPVAESFPPMWFLDQLCLFRHSSGFPHGHVVSSKMLQSGWGLQVTSGCWLPLWWAPFAKTDTKTGSIALNCPFNTVQRSFFQCVLFPPRTNSHPGSSMGCKAVTNSFSFHRHNRKQTLLFLPHWLLLKQLIKRWCKVKCLVMRLVSEKLAIHKWPQNATFGRPKLGSGCLALFELALLHENWHRH